MTYKLQFVTTIPISTGNVIVRTLGKPTREGVVKQLEILCKDLNEKQRAEALKVMNNIVEPAEPIEDINMSAGWQWLSHTCFPKLIKVQVFNS